MFGYININQKELTEEGKKAYQAYYCGLYPVFPDRADTDTDHGAWRFVLCADTVS